MENKIRELKLKAAQYEKLSDYEKITRQEYFDIIDEKEDCAYMLNDYKNKFNNINNTKLDVKFEESQFEDTMNKINTIKQDFNNCKDIGAMIQMYENLSAYQHMLESYFENKKMEVLHI